MNPTSFVNEHSAEYVLVPAFVRILAAQYPAVIPVFFWRTREGGRLARAGMGNAVVKVVTVYARRPKLSDPGDAQIVMRVNPELLEAASLAANLGSPVFAGVPLATSICEFTLETRCAWFVLRRGASSDLGEDVVIDVADPGIGHLGGLVEGPIDDATIREIVRVEAEPMPWRDAVDVIATIRRVGGGDRPFGSYRPFQLIIPCGPSHDC